MKISVKTLQILKNFSTINNSIYVLRGNEISVISKGKNVLAVAKVDENFPFPFAIYELNKFIAALSMFINVDFKEEYAELYNDGGSKLKYYYCDPEFITYVEPEKISMLDQAITSFTFELSSDNLSRIEKISSIMKLDTLSVVGDGNKLQLIALQDKQFTKDNFVIDLGNSDYRGEWNIEIENLKLMKDEYFVSISPKFWKFYNTDKSLCYWIALKK